MSTTTTTSLSNVTEVATTTPATDERAQALAHFHAYRKLFNKTYSEANPEFEERLAAFIALKKRIDEINENKDGKYTFKAGLNHFADLSHADFNGRYKGYVRYSAGADFLSPQATSRLSTSKLTSSALDTSTLPASVDWVAAGAVTSVKNQGTCGSCWTFSATGAIEGARQIQSGILTALSQEELLECPTSPKFTSSMDGCGGGDFEVAFAWVSQNGLDSDAAYPYTSGNGQVGANCLATSNGQAITPGELYQMTRVPNLDNTALMTAVASQPVSIAIDADATGGTLQTYTNGIWNTCGGQNPDHAVLLVGYGSENNQDYWLVKNSWGTSWGEDGYFRMQRLSGTTPDDCEMIYYAAYPTVTSGDAPAFVNSDAAVRSWDKPGFFVLLLQLFVLHFFLFKRR